MDQRSQDHFCGMMSRAYLSYQCNGLWVSAFVVLARAQGHQASGLVVNSHITGVPLRAIQINVFCKNFGIKKVDILIPSNA